MIFFIGVIFIQLWLAGFGVVGFFQPDNLSLVFIAVFLNLDNSGSFSVFPGTNNSVGVILLNRKGKKQERTAKCKQRKCKFFHMNIFSQSCSKTAAYSKVNNHS
jgi:hypothetical protein